MENNNNFKNLAQKFIDNLYSRRRKIDLNSFDKEKWFNGTWGTINESLRNKGGYGYLHEEKDIIKDKLYTLINNFPNEENEIDNWYKSSITSLSDTKLLTIGRSQKLINILIKYYISNYMVYQKENDINTRLYKNLDKIHIPIDRIVLTSLRSNYPEFKSIIDSSKRFPTSKGKFSWSNLNDIDVYMDFQNSIREKSKELKFDSPLHFEMAKLW